MDKVLISKEKRAQIEFPISQQLVGLVARVCVFCPLYSIHEFGGGRVHVPHTVVRLLPPLFSEPRAKRTL